MLTFKSVEIHRKYVLNNIQKNFTPFEITY